MRCSRHYCCACNVLSLQNLPQEETGPGLSENDEITLPYATVSGFVYLLGTIDEDQQQEIDNEMHVSHTAIRVCIYHFSGHGHTGTRVVALLHVTLLPP
jgi:hypothetical protein